MSAPKRIERRDGEQKVVLEYNRSAGKLTVVVNCGEGCLNCPVEFDVTELRRKLGLLV